MKQLQVQTPETSTAVSLAVGMANLALLDRIHRFAKDVAIEFNTKQSIVELEMFACALSSAAFGYIYARLLMRVSKYQVTLLM